jgi:Fic family protein
MSYMDVGKFGESPIGRVVPIRGEHRGRPFSHFAYVPDPLPEKLRLSTSTVLDLTQAVAAIARLDGAGRLLPSSQLLVRPATRREAVSTSALEGTYTTLPEVLQSELFEDEEQPSRQVNEVLAYVRASEEGYARIRADRPLTLKLLRDLHGILVREDPDVSDHEKGEFRARQVFVGPRDAHVEECFYVPPPAGDLLSTGLNEWERWIHRQDLPLLLRVALGHYQLEALHPFVDGNGRMGRLAAILMLLEEHTLSVPLLTISPFLEVRRDAYQQRLRDVSITGDFDAWASFFFEALTSSAEDALVKTDQLLALKEEMVGTLRAAGTRGVAIQATEDLIGGPVLSASAVAKRYKITYQAAVYTLDRMVGAGILESFKVRGRRVYVAPRVFSILSP